MLYGSMLHIPPTNLPPLAAKQEPYKKKSLSPNKTFRETFKQRHIVERTHKADIRPEEQTKKAENCRENIRNEIQVKGP